MPPSDDDRHKPRTSRSKPSSDLLRIFSRVFNAALDDIGIPELHFGRNSTVAARYGVSVSTARKWVTGECLPDMDKMIEIADDLGYSVDELLGHTKNVQTKGIEVPIMERSRQPGKSESYHFDAKLLDRAVIHGINNIQVYIVENNDMAPTLCKGYYTFIDTAALSIENQRMYMLETESGDVIIRNIVINLDGDFVLQHDKRDNVLDEVVAKSDVLIGDWSQCVKRKKKPKYRLIGQVRWKFGKLKR